MTTDAAPNKRTSTFTLRAVAAIVLFFVPAVVLAFTPLAATTVLAFVALIPALLGLLYGRRFAFATCVATAALVGLVELANPSAVAAVALMVLVGLGVGAAALRGWQGIATVVATWPAVLLVSAPLAVPAPSTGANGWSASAGSNLDWLFAYPGLALLATLVTLVGGLFTIGVARVLITDLPRSVPAPIDRQTALVYGVALAVVLGLATVAATIWAHGSTAGWALLTILVVARPGLTETRHRVLLRSAGTLAGGAGAALLALVVPVSVVLTIVGIVALGAAILLQLKKANYAVYSVALTAAIVLLNSGGGNVFAVDVQRVLFTIAGAVLAAAAVAILQLALGRRLASRSAATAAAAAAAAPPAGSPPAASPRETPAPS
ncbi:MAG: hypothetical protein JWQ19_2537 [Subtercola sp.]|nr:hypothetical protein [Subtercola sp.]